MTGPLSIVLNYRRTAKYAFNVLVGALEIDPRAHARRGVGPGRDRRGRADDPGPRANAPPGRSSADGEGHLPERVHGHVFMPLPGTPWRGERPGTVTDATRGKLDQLASRGKLYGQWARQAAVARRLATLRDEAAT